MLLSSELLELSRDILANVPVVLGPGIERHAIRDGGRFQNLLAGREKENVVVKGWQLIVLPPARRW
jgi:hypothetical protein